MLASSSTRHRHLENYRYIWRLRRDKVVEKVVVAFVIKVVVVVVVVIVVAIAVVLR